MLGVKLDSKVSVPAFCTLNARNDKIEMISEASQVNVQFQFRLKTTILVSVNGYPKYHNAIALICI